MARGNLDVYVVDVGQGQCTFVAFWNASNTKIVETLLFDCGSDKRSGNDGVITYTNLDAIADKVLSMDTPAIDCIIFSHSDKDHISLTKYLLDKITETKKPSVTSVWYGGNWKNYTKYRFNILDYLHEEDFVFKSSIMKTKVNYTSYASGTDSFTKFFWSSQGLEVWPIASNVLASYPVWDDDGDVDMQRTAEEKNRVSIVCGIKYLNTTYVVCGDATNVTMAAIGSLFSGGTNLFNMNAMTTLPHHGSRATGFAVSKNKDASDESIKIVDTFAKTLKSQTITVSAYEKHHHPSLELMNRFVPKETSPIIKDPRLTSSKTHRLTAYLDTDVQSPTTGIPFAKGDSMSFDTQSNMFSTKYAILRNDGTYSVHIGYEIGKKKGYFLKSPYYTSALNEHACWGYTTPSSGSFAYMMGGYPDLSKGLFTQPATSSSALATTNLESKGSAMLLEARPMYGIVRDEKGARVPMPAYRSVERSVHRRVIPNTKHFQL